MNQNPNLQSANKLHRQFINKVVLGALITLFLSLGSAAYCLTNGLNFTTKRAGSWVSWVDAGRRGADPYTRAYIAKNGYLFLTPPHGRTYLAYQDNHGQRLTSDCSYRINGDADMAKWWELSAYSLNGKKLITNEIKLSFSKNTIMIMPDDRFYIKLSKTVQDGNWLPIASDGRFLIRLHLYRPKSIENTHLKTDPKKYLPQIKRVKC